MYFSQLYENDEDKVSIYDFFFDPAGTFLGMKNKQLVMVLYLWKSPAGTALWNGDFVSSLRDFGGRVFSLNRRLKPPVNKVSSLRDLC